MTLIAVLLTAIAANAHVEPGLYKGKTPAGQDCEMRAIEMHFENNTPHPLNERITIETNGKTFVVNHPSAIDRQNAQVTFNHDRFEGLLANPTGANAIIIDMQHSQNFEGPTSFDYIDHNWHTKTSTKVECKSIQIQP